ISTNSSICALSLAPSLASPVGASESALRRCHNQNRAPSCRAQRGRARGARVASDSVTRWRRNQTPGTGARGVESARTPGMVDRE
ncbi:hypothetical protein, partial [Natronoglomus mannanivorans]|nr:hypothetical protein [Halobacteria archaeon AArc-xg1-1]